MTNFKKKEKDPILDEVLVLLIVFYSRLHHTTLPFLVK